MQSVTRLTLVFAATSLVLGACRKKPAVAPQAQVAPVAPPVAEPTRATPSAPVARDTMEEYRSKLAATRARLLETIYFAYDADELQDDAKANLDAKLTVLNGNPGLTIRISGHCDERGSDEYNIALGRRRAEAAKRYLIDRGIDASRIETSSFGRERPAAQGTSEDSWSRNRRDEFEIIAGGDQLRAS